jgi:hypothetical protein
MIQSAVNFAADGDTVLVASGVYNAGEYITPDGTLSNRVVITKNIQVIGVDGPSNTFIVGSGSVGDDAVRCVYITNGLLAGFTLTNGHTRAGGVSVDINGGGAYAVGGILTNCIIVGNSAQACGGGVYGGRVVNCLVQNNTAEYGGGGYDTVFDTCSLLQNRAGGQGGGSWGGSLNQCTLRQNYGPAGGALYRSEATNCIIDANSADRGGGAMYSGLYRCRITGNSVNGAGGGMHTCTALCSFVSGNWAGWAGGGARESMLINCTVVQNWAGVSGDRTSQETIRNSIVYYNRSETRNHESALFEYSCTTPLPSGSGNITNEPQFAENYRLSAISPCVNTGTMCILAQ